MADVTTGRSRATWALTALVGLCAAALLVVGVRALLRATGVLAIDAFEQVQGGAGQLGIFSDEALRTTEGLTAGIASAAALVCLFLLTGLLRLRPAAREGVMGVFGLGGLALALRSLSGLAQGGQNAPRGSSAVSPYSR